MPQKQSLLHVRLCFQCRSVKIAIVGDQGLPVQVDGEAWIQPPGFIRIDHKNRAQMLTRDKVFEEALKTWSEKQKLERPVSPRQNLLTEEESSILQSFVEATEVLVKRCVNPALCRRVDFAWGHLLSCQCNVINRFAV